MTREDLATFVASLAIPPERREIVLSELTDHLEQCTRDGVDPGFGDLGGLKAKLERVEGAFRFSLAQALGRGLLTSGAVIAASLLASLIPLPALRGDSLAVRAFNDLLVLVPGALASPLLLWATPLALRAQLRRAFARRERRRGLRAAWPAIAYLSLVTWIPLYSMLGIADLIDSEAVEAAYQIPMLVAFVALLVEAIRARGEADTRITG